MSLESAQATHSCVFLNLNLYPFATYHRHIMHKESKLNPSQTNKDGIDIWPKFTTHGPHTSITSSTIINFLITSRSALVVRRSRCPGKTYTSGWWISDTNDTQQYILCEPISWTHPCIWQKFLNHWFYIHNSLVHSLGWINNVDARLYWRICVICIDSEENIVASFKRHIETSTFSMLVCPEARSCTLIVMYYVFKHLNSLNSNEFRIGGRVVNKDLSRLILSYGSPFREYVYDKVWKVYSDQEWIIETCS